MQKQLIEEAVKEFDKLYVHKGEDGDDPEEEWAWNIRGSFPIEVKLFFEEALKTIASKSAEKAVLEYILSLGWQDTENEYVKEVLEDADKIAKSFYSKE